MEEVWKLAAEFQTLQLSSAKQKLSDRNVIELVTKLQELHMIDVLYTSDGKTYLTHSQLAREIKDELIVNGGRINLVDLQQLLNVDYTHIEAKVHELVKHDSTLILVLGQLINDSYRTRLAEEINDFLQEQGHVTVGELTKTHDLPATFIREVIEGSLGKKIKGQLDSVDRDVVFTEAFVNRKKAQIRGSLSAVTVPTSLGSIRHTVECQEYLFHSILDDLLTTNRLAGNVTGSRNDKSQFLPEVYTRAQTAWVDSFYNQNGFLDYDSVSRQGIVDPKGFLRNRFRGASIVFLSSCCVGPSISEQVNYSVSEALNSGTWVDLITVLPSMLSNRDIGELLGQALKANKGSTHFVCEDTIVASESLVTDSAPLFSDLMLVKAQKIVLTDPGLLSSDQGAGGDKSIKMKEEGGKEDRKEQRRKKAASAGSTKKEGTGGREVKMKSVKKKGRGRDIDDGSDEDTVSSASGRNKQQEIPFMTIDEIAEVLRKQPKLTDCPDELVMDIASRLHRPLQKQYQEVAKSIFLKTSGAEKKKSAGEVQDKVNGLWTNIKLFEKGLNIFEESIQNQLTKHLLKTICSDLTNTVVEALATDALLGTTKIETDTLSPDGRLRLIGKLPSSTQEPLRILHQTLGESSLDPFLSQLEVVCGPTLLGILLKKPDKNKERTLVFHHRQNLCEQIKEQTDPAMTLHLAVIILFQTITQCMLHAPGRLVPQILIYLQCHLDSDKLAPLSKMQDLVVQHLKYKAETDHENLPGYQETVDAISELLGQVKEIALITKKASTTKDN